MNGQQPPQGGYPQPGYGAPQGYGAPGHHPQQGGYVPQHGGQPMRPPPVRLSAGLYVTMYIICQLASNILVAAATNRATKEAAPAVPIPIVVGGIFMLVLVYKMYKALNDGVTSPKPGLAVGLFFVPLFNIVWYFIVWCKFPGQYNAFSHRHGIRVQPLSTGFYVAATICGLFVPLIGLILMAIMIGKTAGAVNALSAG